MGLQEPTTVARSRRGNQSDVSVHSSSGLRRLAPGRSWSIVSRPRRRRSRPARFRPVAADSRAVQRPYRGGSPTRTTQLARVVRTGHLRSNTGHAWFQHRPDDDWLPWEVRPAARTTRREPSGISAWYYRECVRPALSWLKVVPRAEAGDRRTGATTARAGQRARVASGRAGSGNLMESGRWTESLSRRCLRSRLRGIARRCGDTRADKGLYPAM